MTKIGQVRKCSNFFKIIIIICDTLTSIHIQWCAGLNISFDKLFNKLADDLLSTHPQKQESVQNFLDDSVAIYPSNFFIRLRNKPGNHTVAHFATRSGNIRQDRFDEFPGSTQDDSRAVHVQPERIERMLTPPPLCGGVVSFYIYHKKQFSS